MVKKKRVVKKRNKVDNSLRGLYRQNWDYIKSSRNFIYAVVGVFVVFALIGFFVPPTPEVKDMILKFIEELIAQTEGMSQIELTLFIFLNNLQSSFFGLVFGIVLGIFPFLAAVANGYVIGFVSKIVVSEVGIAELWRLMPHGIFELPAIFISFGLGLRLGCFIFQKEKIKSLKYFAWNSLIVFLLVIIPLLIIAAIIEGGLIVVLG